MSKKLENLAQNLEEIQNRIHASCQRAGRRVDEVTLVAVSKTHSAAKIRALYAAGQRDFGESYVQEWQEKAAEFKALDAQFGDLRWHFIGHLQSNKAKYLVDDIALIQSVGRASVMKQLNRRAHGAVDVLLDVNIGGESSKSGVLPEELPELLAAAWEFEHLRIRGLMCIPPFAADPQESRPYFRQMRELFKQSRDWIAARVSAESQSDQPAEQPGSKTSKNTAFADFEHLSMGMSADFEVAIEEGATIVRVGTALFGERDYVQ